MNIKWILRGISLIMLAAAIVFVGCALSCPTLGRTIYIGDFAFGAKQWRVCYLIYIIIMAVLFVASFMVGNARKKSADSSGEDADNA